MYAIANSQGKFLARLEVLRADSPAIYLQDFVGLELDTHTRNGYQRITFESRGDAAKYIEASPHLSGCSVCNLDESPEGEY